jgi:hypothetical protein
MHSGWDERRVGAEKYVHFDDRRRPGQRVTVVAILRLTSLIWLNGRHARGRREGRAVGLRQFVLNEADEAGTEVANVDIEHILGYCI